MASGSGSLCSRISTRSASEKIALILLDLLPGHRATELDEQGRAGQLGERQARDFGKRLAAGRRRAGHPRAACPSTQIRVPPAARTACSTLRSDRRPLSSMMTQVAGVTSARTKVSITFRVADADAETGLVEPPRQRGALDQNVELAAGGEDCIEQSNHQLRVTDRQAPHSEVPQRPASGVSITDDL